MWSAALSKVHLSFRGLVFRVWKRRWGEHDLREGQKFDVEGALDIEAADIGEVGIDLRRTDVFMPQEFLNGAEVIAVFDESCSERMAEGMTAPKFRDTGLADGGFDGALERALVDMVAVFGAGGVGGAAVAGREEVLPGEFAGGAGVFAGEGFREG